MHIFIKQLSRLKLFIMEGFKSNIIFIENGQGNFQKRLGKPEKDQEIFLPL